MVLLYKLFIYSRPAPFNNQHISKTYVNKYSFRFRGIPETKMETRLFLIKNNTNLMNSNFLLNYIISLDERDTIQHDTTVRVYDDSKKKNKNTTFAHIQTNLKILQKKNINTVRKILFVCSSNVSFVERLYDTSVHFKCE